MPPEVAASLKEDHAAKGVTPTSEQFSPAIPVKQTAGEGNHTTSTLQE
jgi:cytochrome c-type biogenesis protein CcmE